MLSINMNLSTYWGKGTTKKLKISKNYKSSKILRLSFEFNPQDFTNWLHTNYQLSFCKQFFETQKIKTTHSVKRNWILQVFEGRISQKNVQWSQVDAGWGGQLVASPKCHWIISYSGLIVRQQTVELSSHAVQRYRKYRI